MDLAYDSNGLVIVQQVLTNGTHSVLRRDSEEKGDSHALILVTKEDDNPEEDDRPALLSTTDDEDSTTTTPPPPPPPREEVPPDDRDGMPFLDLVSATSPSGGREKFICAACSDT